MRFLVFYALFLSSAYEESHWLHAQSFRSLPIESAARENLARNFPINRYAELQDRYSQSQFVKSLNFQWAKQRRDGTPLTWPNAVSILKDAGSIYWDMERLRTFDKRVKGPTYAYVRSEDSGNGVEIKFVVYNKLSSAIAVVEMERWANGKKAPNGFNKTLSLWAGFNFRKLENGDPVTYDGGVCITEALSKQPVGPNKTESLVIVLPAKLPPLP